MQLSFKIFPHWLEQAVRFGTVGVFNTLIDLGIYTVLTHFLPVFASAPVAAKGFSYTTGILNSFFLNRSWTFNSQVDIRRSLPLFFIINITGLFINTAFLGLSLNYLHLAEPVSLAAATLSSLAWNFTASKIIFR